MTYSIKIALFLMPCVDALFMEEGRSAKRIKTEPKAEEAEQERPPIKQEIKVKTENNATPEAPPGTVVKVEQIKREPMVKTEAVDPVSIKQERVVKKEEHPQRDAPPPVPAPPAAPVTPDYSKDIDELSFFASADYYNFDKWMRLRCDFSLRIYELSMPHHSRNDESFREKINLVKEEIRKFEQVFHHGRPMVCEVPPHSLDGRLEALRQSGQMQQFLTQLEKEAGDLKDIAMQIRTHLRARFDKNVIAASIERLKEQGKMRRDDQKEFLFALRDAMVKNKVRAWSAASPNNRQLKLQSTSYDDLICEYFDVREHFFARKRLLEYIKSGPMADQFEKDDRVFFDRNSDEFALSK